jgi:hypothetical protein
MKMPNVGIRSFGNSVVKVRMFIGRAFAALAGRISEKAAEAVGPIHRGQEARRSTTRGCAGGRAVLGPILDVVMTATSDRGLETAPTGTSLPPEGSLLPRDRRPPVAKNRDQIYHRCPTRPS